MDKKKPGSLEKKSEKKLFLRGEILYRFGEKILFFSARTFSFHTDLVLIRGYDKKSLFLTCVGGRRWFESKRERRSPRRF